MLNNFFILGGGILLVTLGLLTVLNDNFAGRIQGSLWKQAEKTYGIKRDKLDIERQRILKGMGSLLIGAALLLWLLNNWQ